MKNIIYFALYEKCKHLQIAGDKFAENDSLINWKKTFHTTFKFMYY